MMERCREITVKIMEKPISAAFNIPIDSVLGELDGYTDKIKKPIDLPKVMENLNRRKYSSPYDWYKDMVLVFQNAIDYYPETEIYSIFAKYLLMVLNKLAVGLNLESENEWTKSVVKMSKKLTEVIGNPPSTQKSSQLISELRTKIDNVPPLKPQEIPVIVDKLNTIISKDENRENVIAILKGFQGSEADELIKKPIDLDKLSPAATKALICYVQQCNYNY